MTDLTSSRYNNLGTVIVLPRLAIASCLARLNETLGAAFQVVYVAPYVARSPNSKIIEGSEAGRDPSW